MESDSKATTGSKILALGHQDFSELLRSACGESCVVEAYESLAEAEAALKEEQGSFSLIVAQAAVLEETSEESRKRAAEYSDGTPLILVTQANRRVSDALAEKLNTHEVVEIPSTDNVCAAQAIALAVRANVAEQRNTALQETLDQLKQLTIKDALTGVYNVRYFWARFRYEFLRAIRYEQSLSCLMLDLDRFKSVNDRHGHQVGDDLLRLVAETIGNSIRKVDIIARYGGEEFAILLPNTSAEGALRCAENIREMVSVVGLIIGESQIKTTISIGVSVLTQEVRDESELLQQADSALNEAKRAGRNKVLCWADPPTPS